MSIGLVLVIGALAFVIWITRNPVASPATCRPQDAAIRGLRGRLARGEITTGEFAEIARALRD